ncbi:hypothetical protein B0T16DRAFT_445684 [Cercophora newfieldiana]|uniref:NAD(P)-binding protein n=1 Tax=Cercophora newfieldiana TaxID=92897 RepID=A0AA40CNS4_9PEZI|nr:hypothetical protein B0T16DRAFT_445684 [Cercophora newfieldiana]
MVKITDINTANAALKSSPPLTAVVVGGTHGIGRAFLTQLTANTTSPKVYIVGRDSAALDKIIADLTTLNPTGTYIPILTPDLTLIANAHAAATQILALEPAKIDILYLSPGYLSFSARNPSPEGIDRLHCIRYLTRMRFILDLMPRLLLSPSPHVLTVLGAGQEGKIFPEDLPLLEDAHSGPMVCVGASMTYTTLFLEQLAKRYPKVSFVHSFPGMVKTNVYNHPEHLHWAVRFLANWVVFPLLGWLITVPVEEAGARCLYLLTSGEFAPAEKGGQEGAVGSDGKKGSGVYTVDEKCAVVQNKRLVEYREKGLGEKVYEYTMGEFGRVLASSLNNEMFRQPDHPQDAPGGQALAQATIDLCDVVWKNGVPTAPSLDPNTEVTVRISKCGEGCFKTAKFKNNENMPIEVGIKDVIFDGKIPEKVRYLARQTPFCFSYVKDGTTQMVGRMTRAQGEWVKKAMQPGGVKFRVVNGQETKPWGEELE